MLYLTSQLTSQNNWLVNWLVNRRSSQSCQFPALMPVPVSQSGNARLPNIWQMKGGESQKVEGEIGRRQKGEIEKKQKGESGRLLMREERQREWETKKLQQELCASRHRGLAAFLLRKTHPIKITVIDFFSHQKEQQNTRKNAPHLTKGIVRALFRCDQSDFKWVKNVCTDLS